MLTAVALLTATAFGCGGGASEEDCKKLLSHVVDLYSSIPDGETLTPQAEKDLEAQKAAVEKGLGKEFLDQCEDKSTEVVRCSLKARDLEELGKCEDEG